MKGQPPVEFDFLQWGGLGVDPRGVKLFPWGMKTRLLVLVLVLACFSCRAPLKAENPLSKAPEVLPEGFQDEVARAEAAMAALGAQLLPRLAKALGEGDEVSALKVCQVEAQELTEDVASKQQLQLGRTSFRIRNSKNAPRPWALPWVMQGATHEASKEPLRVIDLGNRVGVLKPIATQALCLKCHGNREDFSSELKAALKQAYPEDLAVGFKEGEVRGYFWAEVPREKKLP